MKRLSAQDHQALKALLQQKGLLSKHTTPDSENQDAVWPAGSSVQRVWLQESLDGDPRVNGLGLELKLSRPQPLANLQQALQALVSRHETLRTVYTPKDELLYARVLPSMPVPMAPALVSPDAETLAALLRDNGPTLEEGKNWRVHPVIDNVGECTGLVWLMHHALCDWFGLQVLVQELVGLLDGRPLPDSPPLQPRQVSLTEQRRDSDRVESSRAYWQQRLEGAPGYLSLPVSLAYPPHQPAGKTVERFSVTVPATLATILRATCREFKTTPYFFFLTVLTRLLQRLTLNDEVVIATTIAHRDKPGAQTLVGCLSDLVPLRCNPANDADFLAALRHIQTQVSADMAHAELGLRQIIDAARPERRPGKAPLTQVMFNLLPPATTPGVQLVSLPLPVPRTDLVLEIIEQDTFTAHVECRLNPFPAGFARTLAEVWLGDLTIALGDEPSSQHIMTCENRPALLPQANVIDLFDEQVRKTPDATALINSTGKLSYASLALEVEQLAQRLQRHPAFRPGCRVATWLPRSQALVISVLACLKTGGIIMLLDPSHPIERQRQILANAKPDLMLALSGALPPVEAATPLLYLDTQAPDALRQDGIIETSSHRSDTAFIAFTSGSTGVPKGVLCTQRALVNRLAWYALNFPPANDDVACLKTSPGFVDIYAEMLGPLCAGLPLVVANDSEATDPEALASLIQHHQVTRLVLVPTLLQALLDQKAPEKLHSLRLCACSGESLSPMLAQAFFQSLPNARLLNIYGSSEVTADATCADITPAFGARTDIGQPLPGVGVAVVDSQGRKLPDGFPGELAISGIGLADGYLDDPALTAKRFQPISAFGGQRAFLSGDRAVQLPRGPLLLLGRNDRQFKLEGVRIDAAEIETAITSLDDIRQCRVVLDLEGGSPRLLAALTSKTTVNESWLRQQLQTRLPRAAMPQVWLWFDTLPLGPTGKIDDAAILALGKANATTAQSGSDLDHAPLQDELERQLAAQWSDILGCTVNHRHAHFFDLGGTSLKAIMAMNRVRKAFDSAAEAHWLFEAPTLAAMAERIRQTPGVMLAARHAGTDATSSCQINEPSQAPLTFNQQWLVREYTQDPDRTAYNLAIAYRFDGAANPQVLQAALQKVADHHAALRTRLHQVNGQWQQVIAPPGSPLPVVISNRPDLDDTQAEQYRDTWGNQPFQLDGGPLFRVEICMVNPARLYLFMMAHHAVIDGWSSERLMHDLAQSYAALCGDGPPLSTPPVGIGQIALRQQNRRTTLVEALPAYHTYVSQGACPRCPCAGQGAPRGGPLAHMPVCETANSPTPAGEITPFMQGLTALTLALQQFNTLDRPVLIGFPEAGRHDPDLEHSAAFIANTVLGCFDLPGQTSLKLAFDAVKQQLLEALTFREIPVSWLQGSGWKGLDERSDDLHVMVIPEQDFDWRLKIAGLNVISLGQATASQARVDIALTIKSGGNGKTRFELEYDSGRVPQVFAQRLSRVLSVLLNPGTRIDTVPEWARCLPDQTAYAADPRPGQALVATRLEGLVADWVTHNPAQTLAVDANSTLSAAQLWAHSQALAQMLQSNTTQPTVVALSMDRSTEWLACLLAIWQIGATAVIIDPQWPAERAEFVVQDCAASVIWRGGTHLERRSVTSTLATASPSPVAAIVYTSGSSGRPKGVPVRHDALIRLGQSLSHHYDLTTESRILQVVAPGFDVALSDIAMAWCSGATLVTLPRHDVMPGTTLNQAIDYWNITHFQAPAAVLNSTPAKPHPSLKTVAVGGEICPASTLDAWAEGRQLFIVYGPTEATVTVSLARYQRGQTPGSLGAPIAGNRLAIIDAHRQPRLFGMPGELLIAGDQVAQGYHGHAAPLSNAFDSVALLEETRPGYRTGDRAWMDESGHVWLLGRLDRQFKIRGQRIDPEEIEVTLRTHPSVDQVAVTALTAAKTTLEPAADTQDIIAWVVPSTTPPPSAETLREWLQARLPAAWLPARWMFIDTIPLNANGKTDWVALNQRCPEPAAADQPPAPQSMDLPQLNDRDDLFDFLLACWCELLERDDIDEDRSFFDYGGHSMLTVKLHERLEQATGLTLPIGEIFGHPTLNEMTDYLFEQISTVNGAS